MAETVIGFLLALCCNLLRQDIDSQPWKRLKTWTKKPLERGFEAFFTSAVYFTMSILIGSNYALVKRDYEISANGFGILQLQITSAITVVSALPLLYPIIIRPEQEQRVSHSDLATARKEAYNRTLREKFRLILLGLVLALFIYPFLSQCIHNWAPTDVGEDNGPDGTTIVKAREWAKLTATCFGEVDPITVIENKVILTFELLGSLCFIFTVLWTFVRLLFREQTIGRYQCIMQNHIVVITRRMLNIFTVTPGFWLLCRISLLIGTLLLSIPLLWAIFRLREVQKALATATASVYLDNEWSFGQVVALAVFAPVLFDTVYCLFEL